jgi:hypothetical protein
VADVPSGLSLTPPQETKKVGTDEYYGKTKLDYFEHFHLFPVGFILLKYVENVIRAQALYVVFLTYLRRITNEQPILCIATFSSHLIR